MCKSFVRTKDDIMEPLGPALLTDDHPVGEMYDCYDDLRKKAQEAGTRRMHGFCMSRSARRRWQLLRKLLQQLYICNVDLAVQFWLRYGIFGCF